MVAHLEDPTDLLELPLAVLLGEVYVQGDCEVTVLAHLATDWHAFVLDEDLLTVLQYTFRRDQHFVAVQVVDHLVEA